MPVKKIIFFPDALHDNSLKLKTELKKLYQCFQSKQVDEYDQVFRQSGKFAIIFSDAQMAVKFLEEKTSDLSPLRFKVFAFMNKSGRFSEKSQALLDKYSINVFFPNQFHEIMANIEKYFSQNDVEDDAAELKFSANEDN